MAKLDLKLETTIKPLPRRLHDHDPAALGARPQVRRGDAGAPPSRASPRAARSRSRTRRPSRSSSTSSSTCGTSPRAIGNQQNLRGFGDAFAGRGADLNLALQPFVPLVANAVPVLTNIAVAGDQLPALLRLAGAARRSSPSRSAVQLGELWANLGLTLARVRGRRAPVPAGHHLKGPSGQETLIEEASRTLRPFFRADRRSSSPSCSPARGRSTLARRRSRAGSSGGVKGAQGLARPERAA